MSIEGRLEQYTAAEATLNTLVAQEKAKIHPDTIAFVEAYKAYMNLCVRRGDYKAAYEAAHKFFQFRTALRERRVGQSIKVEAVKYKAAYEREKREEEIKHQKTVVVGRHHHFGIGLLFHVLLSIQPKAAIETGKRISRSPCSLKNTSVGRSRRRIVAQRSRLNRIRQTP